MKLSNVIKPISKATAKVAFNLLLKRAIVQPENAITKNKALKASDLSKDALSVRNGSTNQSGNCASIGALKPRNQEEMISKTNAGCYGIL